MSAVGSCSESVKLEPTLEEAAKSAEVDAAEKALEYK